MHNQYRPSCESRLKTVQSGPTLLTYILANVIDPDQAVWICWQIQSILELFTNVKAFFTRHFSNKVTDVLPSLLHGYRQEENPDQ